MEERDRISDKKRGDGHNSHPLFFIRYSLSTFIRTSQATSLLLQAQSSLLGLQLAAGLFRPLAHYMNVDFVWVHASNTVLESTLAYSLNSTGTPALVVEAGVGMRITKRYCIQLADGLMNIMRVLGIWQGEVGAVRKPLIEDRADGVVFFNAPSAGIFIPSAEHWTTLERGDKVGELIDPLTGEVLSEILTPERGILFTIREYPVVDEGSLVGRLLIR